MAFVNHDAKRIEDEEEDENEYDEPHPSGRVSPAHYQQG
jgi:hypothetical protein